MAQAIKYIDHIDMRADTGNRHFATGRRSQMQQLLVVIIQLAAQLDCHFKAVPPAALWPVSLPVGNLLNPGHILAKMAGRAAVNQRVDLASPLAGMPI